MTRSFTEATSTARQIIAEAALEAGAHHQADDQHFFEQDQFFAPADDWIDDSDDDDLKQDSVDGIDKARANAIHR
jgi:hypothetical protein